MDRRGQEKLDPWEHGICNIYELDHGDGPLLQDAADATLGKPGQRISSGVAINGSPTHRRHGVGYGHLRSRVRF